MFWRRKVVSLFDLIVVTASFRTSYDLAAVPTQAMVLRSGANVLSRTQAVPTARALPYVAATALPSVPAPAASTAAKARPAATPASLATGMPQPPGALATGESSKRQANSMYANGLETRPRLSERKKRTVAPSRECDRPYPNPTSGERVYQRAAPARRSTGGFGVTSVPTIPGTRGCRVGKACQPAAALSEVATQHACAPEIRRRQLADILAKLPGESWKRQCAVAGMALQTQVSHPVCYGPSRAAAGAVGIQRLSTEGQAGTGLLAELSAGSATTLSFSCVQLETILKPCYAWERFAEVKFAPSRTVPVQPLAAELWKARPLGSQGACSRFGRNWRKQCTSGRQTRPSAWP